MDQPHPLADRPIELKLQQFTGSQMPHRLAGSANMCAELDRYDIALDRQAVHGWGGYTAMDAIAAARRERK